MTARAIDSHAGLLSQAAFSDPDSPLATECALPLESTNKAACGVKLLPVTVWPDVYTVSVLYFLLKTQRPCSQASRSYSGLNISKWYFLKYEIYNYVRFLQISLQMTKELYFVDTLVSVKCNKTLKSTATSYVAIKYTALDESLMTNIALGCTLCYSAIFTIQLTPRAVYFIQTGSSALSNSYL